MDVNSVSAKINKRPKIAYLTELQFQGNYIAVYGQKLAQYFIQDLAHQQILFSIDIFLSYRTDYTDSRTI